MGRELFAYWQVAADAAAPAEAAARHLQQALRQQHPGLLARLYRRTGGDSSSGSSSVTLMEAYARPGGVDATLQAAIDTSAAAALAAWCRGARHVEVFDALDACGG